MNTDRTLTAVEGYPEHGTNQYTKSGESQNVSPPTLDELADNELGKSKDAQNASQLFRIVERTFAKNSKSSFTPLLYNMRFRRNLPNRLLNIMYTCTRIRIFSL